jgi:magnesium transporter
MHVLTALERDQIAGLLERDEFFWLDLTSLAEGDLAQLAEVLEVEPRAVRDLSERTSLPRLDDSSDRYVVLAYFGIGGESSDPFAPVEVRMLISGRFIVTTHDGGCSMLEDLARHSGKRHERDEGTVVYKILDALTHSFFTALDALDEEIDQLEDQVLAGADPSHLRRLVGVKNRLVDLRRIATAQRNVLARAGDEISDLPGLQASPRDFRDIYQRMISVSELIDSTRDVLTGAQDVYLSVVSNRLNAVMERLTIVATIFLPLTFLTGFFGQNFGWMVRHVSSFADFMIFGVGGVVLTSVLLLAIFRRAGYIGAGTPRS